ncbi:MAG TPA: helix-turn-helix transcriptional regulator [Thermoguttaceae bacterium]|nr:helix-turn-helix transcriptional regulator [Thermoguttaceae bacterium]
MAPQILSAQSIERRRKSLGMSRAALALRSGVSLPTVNRMLGDDIGRATFSNVSAVADALGMTVDIVPTCSDLELQEQEARAKAKKIVKLVQGTSALETQAVDELAAQEMTQRTVHELMSGSKQRLWST